MGSQAEGKTDCDWCGLKVFCSGADHGQEVSYPNNLILTQLFQGLKTREFSEKVLQKGATLPWIRPWFSWCPWSWAELIMPSWRRQVED